MTRQQQATNHPTFSIGVSLGGKRLAYVISNRSRLSSTARQPHSDPYLGQGSKQVNSCHSILLHWEELRLETEPRAASHPEKMNQEKKRNEDQAEFDG